MKDKPVTIKYPFGEEVMNNSDDLNRLLTLASNHMEASAKIIAGMNKFMEQGWDDDTRERIHNPKEYYAKQKIKNEQAEMKKELSPPAIEVLKNCAIDGTIVKLPIGQLERSIYVEVKKRLELIGGKWKGGKVQGFVFPSDPTELLAEIASGGKRNLKKEFQFFGTPDHLADMLVKAASIKEAHMILEPSAGQGAIIKAIHRVSPGKNVQWFEIMPANQLITSKLQNIQTFIALDFLTYTPKNVFDRVIANPPFNKNQDIDHIRKMYEVCKAGGRIVTIASKHWQHSSNKKEVAFKEWLDEIGATVDDIEAGEFAESGTKIATCMIIIDKQ